MRNSATRYFVQMGTIDAVRGNVLAHIASLPEFARIAYQRGQDMAKPKVYLFKLNRSVGALKSGVTVTRLAKVPQGAKGLVSVLHAGVTLDIPVSRLVRVLDKAPNSL